MSRAFDLARLNRTGAPTFATAQEVRDMTVYHGSPPTYIRTAGALSAGDGGGREWRWDAASVAADTTGSVLQLTDWVGAGRYLAITNGLESAEGYGAVAGVADASTALTNALTGSQVSLASSVGIDLPVVFPYTAELVGYGRSAVVTLSAGLAGLTGFQMNIASDESTWVQSYPNLPGMRVVNLDVDATAATGSTVFKFAGSPWFSNLRISGACQGIEQLPLYCDAVRIENVHFRNSQVQTSDQYLLNLNGLGDNLYVNNVAFGEVEDGEVKRIPNGVYKQRAYGGVVNNIIKGYNTLYRCHGLSASGWHLESGAMVADQSSVSFRDSMVWMRSGDATFVDFGIVPVQFYSDISEFGGESLVENVTWIRHSHPAWENTYPTDRVDMVVRGNIGLEVRSCSRRAFNDSDAVGASTMLGITAGNGTDDWSDFNNYSHFASQSSRFANNSWLISADRGRTVNAVGIVSASIKSGGPQEWLSASGTYYYAVTALYDRVRMIGVNGTAEGSASPTLGGDPVLIILSREFSRGMMVRLYRGTSTGSYTEYVDIPVLSGINLVDNGRDVGGYAWISRTAGGKDSINGSPYGYQLRPGLHNSVASHSDAYGIATVDWPFTYVPPYGTWEPGDRVNVSVKDTGTGGGLMKSYWLRLTAGSGSVVGTDWQLIYGSV